MKEIPLSKGKVALVDDSDFEWLSQWKWSYDGKKYATRTIYLPKADFPTKGQNKMVKVKMHRLILDCKEGEFGDHINGDKLDNRRSNLRKATASQNAMNWSRKSKTGLRGVYADKSAFIARIRVSGKDLYLGYFSSKEEAAREYDKAASIYHKEFAVLNNI